MNANDIKMLKPDQVGAMLNISDRTVRKLGEAGLIPGALRIGRQWRFREDLLICWLEECLGSVPPYKDYSEETVAHD